MINYKKLLESKRMARVSELQYMKQIDEQIVNLSEALDIALTSNRFLDSVEKNQAQAALNEFHKFLDFKCPHSIVTFKLSNPDLGVCLNCRTELIKEWKPKNES